MAAWIADLAIVAGLVFIATLLSKAALVVLNRFWSHGPRSAMTAWMTTYAGWLMDVDAAVNTTPTAAPQQACTQQLGLQAGPGDLSDMLRQVLAPFEERLAALESILNVRIGSLERRLDQHMHQRADTNPAHHQARAVARLDVPDAQAAVPHIDELLGGGAEARAQFKIPSGVWVLLAFGVRLVVAQVWPYLTNAAVL